jgi:uncharacterized membrane protein
MDWHKVHLETRSFGQKLADKVASGMGSWKFIIWQSIIVIVWMILNVIGICHHWDPYPFILLNLLFSTQAAYAAPIIMMSQNRAAERDRANAEADYKVNIDSKKEIEHIIIRLNAIEIDKLNKMMKIVEDMQTHNHEHLHNLAEDVKNIKKTLEEGFEK